MTKFSKYIIITIFISTIFFVSEGLYLLNNNTSAKLFYRLILSQGFAKVSLIEDSFNQFEKAYKVRLEELSNENPILFVVENGDIKLPDNQKLDEDYRQVLGNTDVRILKENYDAWGKVLYTLGLSAYKNKEFDLVVPLWQKAVTIAPEWSYFHIELANYYLSNGDYLKAKEAIANCLEFKYAKNHCQLFLKDNLEKGTVEEIGFLEKIINESI